MQLVCRLPAAECDLIGPFQLTPGGSELPQVDVREAARVFLGSEQGLLFTGRLKVFTLGAAAYGLGWAWDQGTHVLT